MNYKKAIYICLYILLIEVIVFAIIVACDCSGRQKQVTQITENAETPAMPVESTSFINDYEMMVYPWQELGYTSVIDYHNDLLAMNNEAVGIADTAVDLYSSVITDEQKERLYFLEEKMTTALTMKRYNICSEEFDTITTACAEKLEESKPVYSSSGGSGGNYVSNGYGLTKSGGVYYYNDRKETWYSQRVLPGGGLNIPGRHVAEDGTIRDADGYICVAASDLSYGSTVETSLGTGKVYDTGCAAGVTDIYVDW
jgi:hypothetical protein